MYVFTSLVFCLWHKCLLILILVENLVSDDSVLIFNYLHHP